MTLLELIGLFAVAYFFGLLLGKWLQGGKPSRKREKEK